MAGDKLSRRNQVRFTNQLFPETDMRYCNRARFFGIINKISLSVVISIATDNLDGVFVGSYSTIGPKTKEETTEVITFKIK